MKNKEFSGGFNLSDLLKSLGGLLETLKKVDDHDDGEINKIGQFGSSDPKRLKGTYHFKVRLGELGDSGNQSFNRLRQGDSRVECSESCEPIVDVFDEGDHIQVISELPGVEENQLQVQIVDGCLQLQDSGVRNYCVNIPLPCPVDEKTIITLVKNGIVEITLCKTL